MMMYPGLFLTLIIGILLAAIPCHAGQSFTGDLEMSVGGDTMSGIIYVAPGHYRMDLRRGTDDFSVIVDRTAGLTRVLIPEKEQYIELKTSDRMSLMNDPFQALIYQRANADDQMIGMDSISGYQCEQRVLTARDKDIITYWYARRLDFPLKIVNHASSGMLAVIGFINEAPVDSTVFNIPAYYTNMAGPDAESDQAPDWAVDVAKAPIVDLPTDRLMSAGDMIRIKVVPGQSIWARATGGSEGTLARAIPFKDGWPVKKTTMYSNFGQAGVICTRRHETAVEADEVVVRVFDGTATITAKYVDMTEQRLGAGESFTYPVSSDENIELRFVNTDDGRSVCIWEFRRDGLPLPEDQVAPISYRTISLDDEETVERRTLDPSGDALVITVTTGEIVVKLGQYDSFAW